LKLKWLESVNLLVSYMRFAYGPRNISCFPPESAECWNEALNLNCSLEGSLTGRELKIKCMMQKPFQFIIKSSELYLFVNWETYLDIDKILDSWPTRLTPFQVSEFSKLNSVVQNCARNLVTTSLFAWVVRFRNAFYSWTLTFDFDPRSKSNQNKNGRISVSSSLAFEWYIVC